MASYKKTKCQCEINGSPKQYCNRHQCYKTPTEVRLCQLNIPKFQKWENCEGSGQDEDCTPVSPDKDDEIRPIGAMGVGQSYRSEDYAKPANPQQKKGNCPFCKNNTSKEETAVVTEKKRPPSLLQQGWNFASAVTDYVKSGMQNVSEEDFAERMKICDGCEWRSNGRCMKCGCFVNKKASWATADCPIGKWPKLDS